jgi:hypothetical protein
MTSDPRTRYSHPHYIIIAANGSRALRIISERSLRENTRDLILEDLAHKNKIPRDRALTALYYLVSDRARMLHTPTPKKSPMLIPSSKQEHRVLLSARPRDVYRLDHLSMQLPRRAHRTMVRDYLAHPAQDQTPRREQSY